MSAPSATSKDPPPNTWSAPIPASASHARQVYVNGVRAVRTCGNASELFGAMTAIHPQSNTSVGVGYAVTNDVAKVSHCLCQSTRSSIVVHACTLFSHLYMKLYPL